MAEIQTIQQRLEKIARDKIAADIREIREFIQKKGFRKVFDSIKLQENISIDDLFCGYRDNLLQEKAEQFLLTDMVNTEVTAFLSKVDNLSEQIDELRNQVEGGY